MLAQSYRNIQVKEATTYTIKNNNYIPFLNIPETGASFIPFKLSSCLGLRGAKLCNSIKNMRFYYSFDYCSCIF